MIAYVWSQSQYLKIWHQTLILVFTCLSTVNGLMVIIGHNRTVCKALYLLSSLKDKNIYSSTVNSRLSESRLSEIHFIRTNFSDDFSLFTTRCVKNQVGVKQSNNMHLPHPHPPFFCKKRALLFSI